MSDLGLELLIIFLLIFINGLFALAEAALMSARRVRLQQRAEEGDTSAEVALRLVESPNRFLSTVQIGISLVGVLSGAFGGATLSRHLQPWIALVPFLTPYSEALAFGLVVILITYASLVLGELVPKRLALADAERLAGWFSRPLDVLSKMTSPIVSLLSLSTDGILKLFRYHPSEDDLPVTEEEIRVLLEQGTQVGVFEEAEQDMVEGVFRLGGRRVGALMTPRHEISWLDLTETFDENLQRVLQSPHTFFLVADGDLDNVVGLINAKDLLARIHNCQQVDLNELVQPPLFVPESMPALDLLEQVKSAPGHVALVIDEYGGLLGMVTLFDILQSIVGEIPQQGHLAELSAVQREDGSWLIDGLMPVDELKELLDLDELPEEEHLAYQTLGGLMMAYMGAIPTPGQNFHWQGLSFEVMDMDGRRVDKVLVTHSDAPDSEPGEKA